MVCLSDHVLNGCLKVKNNKQTNKRKHTKYSCNLGKRNFVQKAMCFIEKVNGEVIQDSDVIIKEARHFSENLYASRENEPVNFEIRIVINAQTLSDEESNNLEYSQHSNARSMTKSPGSDGYTAEFFSLFLFLFLFFVRRSSCGPIACWILARTSSLVTWSLYEMCSISR